MQSARFTYLIRCLIVALMLMLPRVAIAAPQPPASGEIVDHTADYPQWEDISTKALLAVAAQPSVAAPTAFRIHQEHPSTATPSEERAQHRRQMHYRPLAVMQKVMPRYLHLLQCLRL